MQYVESLVRSCNHQAQDRDDAEDASVMITIYHLKSLIEFLSASLLRFAK